MPDAFKRTAFKRMLTPIVREHSESREAEYQEYVRMRDAVME